MSSTAEDTSGNGKADDGAIEQAVGRLALLSEAAYERCREESAQELGVRVSVLDRLVRQRRARADDSAELPHWHVEPIDEAVDGALLLADIERVFRDYIVLPPGAAEALALWTLHAWTIDASDVSPFMALISPTKRCGKTNALTILYYLTPRSEMASNITPSALFRYIESFKPTLLIDEYDSFAKDNEEMRGILNSGHTKTGAHVVRNAWENGEHRQRRFSTWAPKVIACIGTLPDTMDDRSIVIRLQRKPRAALVSRLRKRDSDEFSILRRQAARWAADNFQHLVDAEPDVPEELHDRAADNWRPLLAIADLVGGNWPTRARDAACALSGDGYDSAVNIELLADIRMAFGNLDMIRSADLVAKLVADPEGPWANWKRGKSLTQKQLAGLLRPFGIIPEEVHPEGRDGPHGKGYKRTSLEEAWAAYLPPPEARKRAHAGETGTFSAFSNAHGDGVRGSENGNLSNIHEDVRACADQRPINDYGVEAANRQSTSDLGLGRGCAQCGDTAGPMVEDKDADGNRVWLHQECRRFWHRAGQRPAGVWYGEAGHG
jgi:putative DNA primase/helicase